MGFRWIWWKSNWISSNKSELSTQCECVFVLVHTMEIWFLLLNGRFFSHSHVLLYLCKVPSINNTRGKNTTYTWDKQTNKNKHTNIYLLKRFTRTMTKLKFFDKYKLNWQITTAKIHSQIHTRIHKIHTQTHKTTEQIAEFSWKKKTLYNIQQVLAELNTLQYMGTCSLYGDGALFVRRTGFYDPRHELSSALFWSWNALPLLVVCVHSVSPIIVIAIAVIQVK